jgi:putative adhesin
MGAMTPEIRSQTFQTPAPVKLRVEIPKGRISITAAETAETTIELAAAPSDSLALDMIAEAEISQSGDEIVVRIRRERRIMFGFGGDVEAQIRVPLGSGAQLGTGAGRIETHGRLGAVEAQSGAGAVRLDEAAEARVRTGAGSISIGAVTGSVDVKSGSGKVRVGRVGADARISTGSGSAELEGANGEAKLTTGAGDIDVGAAGDGVEAFTAAGSVKVGRADHGRVRAKTIAGRVSVSVAEGAAALLDISTMSGRVSSELEASGPPVEGDKRLELIIRTMSGDVNLARA